MSRAPFHARATPSSPARLDGNSKITGAVETQGSSAKIPQQAFDRRIVHNLASDTLGICGLFTLRDKLQCANAIPAYLCKQAVS
jgi:hypothetical protein